MRFAIPDFILKDVAKQSRDPLLQRAIRRTLDLSKELRKRKASPLFDHPATKAREVYDMDHATDPLPGRLVRSEGQDALEDKVANWAFDNAGLVYDYYMEVHGRDSLDNHGMKIVSSVHYDQGYDNAYWNGSQIVYGDGTLFYPLCRDLNVSGHEFSHAITPLEYILEPGALNEHLADVFGLLVKQHYLGHTVSQASWLVGEDIVTDKFPGKAIRTFKNETAYRNDPQPKHRKDQKFGMTELSDNGGVHIWSGIPNRAFREYCVLMEANGVQQYAYETPADIWYDVMTQKVQRFTTFPQFRDMTIQVAKERMAAGLNGAASVTLLEKAWSTVGL